MGRVIRAISIHPFLPCPGWGGTASQDTEPPDLVWGRSIQPPNPGKQVLFPSREQECWMESAIFSWFLD